MNEAANIDLPSKRAPRNRTLTVDATEWPALDANISGPEVLTNPAAGSVIVNADVMDCLDTLPDASFNLLIIDPPYNLDKNFNGNRFYAMKSAGYEDYLRSWFFKLCDKLTPDGSLYMCGDWKCSSSMQRVISERLTIVNRITWQREKGRGANSNWKNSMEDIWFAVNNPSDYYFNVEAVKVRRRVLAPYRQNGKPKDWDETAAGNFRLTYPSNFWDDISVPFWSMPENTDHPTQKPEKLYAKLILASSRPGDNILDPFMGSGTAPVVAAKLGRNCVGIEINHEYCRWAAKRLKNVAVDSSIQGYTDGVFWERNSLSDQKRRRNSVTGCPGSLF